MRGLFALGCVLAAVHPQPRVWAQTGPAPVAAEPTVVHGLYNWVHSTADAERAFAFYRDVLGIMLAPSPFVPNARRPRAFDPRRGHGRRRSSGVSPTPTARALAQSSCAHRTPVRDRAPEFVDIPRAPRAASPWDPGASRLIFRVRDFDGVAAKLVARGAPIVTMGARACARAPPRYARARPGQFFVELIKRRRPRTRVPPRPAQSSARPSGSRSRIRRVARALSRLVGVPCARARAGRWRRARAERSHGRAPRGDRDHDPRHRGRGGLVRFHARGGRDGGSLSLAHSGCRLAAAPARGSRSRCAHRADQAAGYRFLSVDARPIQRPFGRFVFVLDADSILVEYAEPAAEAIE